MVARWVKGEVALGLLRAVPRGELRERGEEGAPVLEGEAWCVGREVRICMASAS